jgi:hypothetical protein
MRIRIRYFFLLMCIVQLNSINAQVDIQWTNLVGCTANGNALTKTATGSSYNAGANSANVLPSGNDGWAEMAVIQLGQKLAFGFSQIDGGTALNTIEYSFETNTNNKLKIYTSGVLSGTYGTNKLGDVLRIERKGTNINFFNNGVLLKTLPLKYNTNTFMVDVSLATSGSVLGKAVASFIKPLTINPIVTDVNSATQTLGSISLNISGGVPPYNVFIKNPYSLNGQYLTGANITNLDIGTYGITVYDNNKASINASFTIYNKLDWRDSTGVLVTDSSLIKNTGINSWTDAGAYSLQELKADESGIITHKITALNTIYAFGLHNTSLAKTGYSYKDMEYSFVISNRNLLIYKKNKLQLRFATKLVIGDELVLSKSKNDIIFYYNGIKLYAFTEPVAYGVSAQVSLFKANTELKQIRTTFVRPLKITYTQQDVNCIKGKYGTLAVTPFGGLAPYSILLDGVPVSKENVFTNLKAGDYKLTVIDASKRELTQIITILNCPMWATIAKEVVVNTNGDLLKNAGFDSWDNGNLKTAEPFAFSETPSWVSFSIPDTLSSFMLGFRSIDLDTTAQSTNYKLWIENSIATIIETDNDGFYNKRQIKRVSKGMGFKVQLTSTGIEYYTRVNTNVPYQLEYISKLFSNSTLIIETNINKVGSTINAVRVSTYGNTTYPIIE